MSQAARAAASSRRKPAPPAVPAVWARDVESVLIAEPALRRRVASLARQINREYAGRDLVVVGLMTGSLVFLGDLLRQLTLPLAVDLMEISSYGAGTVAGQLVCTKEVSLPVRGRDVLVVDDILDTGRTLLAVKRRLQRKRPASLAVCVLLDKPSRRTEEIVPDYTGFQVPDVFVVGYGLDFAERYRNLPFVGVLKAEVYASAGRPGGVRRPRASARPAARRRRRS